jgi:hypothetical protein
LIIDLRGRARLRTTSTPSAAPRTAEPSRARLSWHEDHRTHTTELAPIPRGRVTRSRPIANRTLSRHAPVGSGSSASPNLASNCSCSASSSLRYSRTTSVCACVRQTCRSWILRSVRARSVTPVKRGTDHWDTAVGGPAPAANGGVAAGLFHWCVRCPLRRRMSSGRVRRFRRPCRDPGEPGT